MSSIQQSTSDAFGWQWLHFSELHPEFEDQFLDWIHPIGREFFRGKRVLDAGCGTGRHAYFAAMWGSHEVVAMDLSAAVDAAHSNLAGFENVHVVQGDLLHPPLRPALNGGGFDFVYSIGVLHHLPDPLAGLRALVGLVRPGGTIAVWVYGHENNDFVRRFVEPLRRVSTRVPGPLLRLAAWPLALGFHLSAKVIYRPLSKTNLRRKLPLAEYMTSVADFSFRQNYAIVFDQMAAPSTLYVRGEDLRSWLSGLGLADVRVTSRHGNSWRGQGRVAPPS